MKKIYLLLFVGLMMASASLTAQNAKSKIKFDKLQHSFGTFKEELGLQSVVFNFKNEGTAPLILNAVQVTCGCTTPEWTREPVAPGANGKIKVSYDPANRPGVFNKAITVQSNAENPNVVLTISGEVIRREPTLEEIYINQIGPLRAKTNHLALQSVKLQQVRKDSVEVINMSDKPVQLGFKTPPPHITAVFKPTKLAPKQKGYVVVTFDANKIQTFGYVSYRIYLNVDGQENYANSFAVSATLEEDFSKLSAQELANAPVTSFDSDSFDFGDIKPNSKSEHVFTLTNKGKMDLLIRNVASTCGCTVVSPQKNKLAAGESTPIKVVFDSTGKTGRQNKVITVITNDPKNPTSSLRISGNVATL